MSKISSKSIERLSLYRRLLAGQLLGQNKEFIYSYELAELAQITPAQVRRDLMPLEHTGNSRRGYKVSELIREISDLLGITQEQKILLIGLGHLGKAIRNYFYGKRKDLTIVATFDNQDIEEIGQDHDCPHFHVNQLEEKIKEFQSEMAILTVPGPSAQTITDRMISSGIKSIINFSPVPLKVPDHVFVEHIDITSSIEKAAYFAQVNKGEKRIDFTHPHILPPNLSETHAPSIIQ